MTLRDSNHRQLWFRADWLLECCFGYEDVSWGQLGNWARSNRLWTDENGDESDSNPIPVNSRRRVLNAALKLLESLGHIDVIWPERVVPRPVSWVRACWEPDRDAPAEWVLSGTRCEDMKNHLGTEVDLIEEALLHGDFKDKEIRDLQREERFNLSVRLPDRISVEAAAAPEKPDDCVSLGSAGYPGSWELALSVSRADDLFERAIRFGKAEWIGNDLLSHMRWLRPRENRFTVGDPPPEFSSHKLCLTERIYQSRGWSQSFEAIIRVQDDTRPGLTKVSKLDLNREECNWLSYYLLLEDMRTLLFDPTENILSHPVTMDLPTIIGRILALCSGRSPRTELIGGKRYIRYSSVSSVLALTVAEKLNVELIVV